MLQPFIYVLQEGLKGKCSCSRNKEKKDHWLDYAVDDYGVSIHGPAVAAHGLLCVSTLN